MTPTSLNFSQIAIALLVLLLSAHATAQDLSLQLNFLTPELNRGEVLDTAFVVSNTTTDRASAYQVEIYGSRDRILDGGDILLGTFFSDDGIPEMAFRENTLSLDTCLLNPGSWRVIGRITNVRPTESNPLNNEAIAPLTLTLSAPGDSSGDCATPPSEPLINPGLNDAWFDPETPGQGFFLTVFPETGVLFLAWFTFDLTLASENLVVRLGAPGHRWLTAAGGWSGNRAELQVSNTSGGVFDRSDPAVVTDADYGRITIEFLNCNAAEVVYELPDAGVSGTLLIERVVAENAGLCEALAGLNSTRNDE